MVEVSEEFLERINTNNNIRSYLLNYPFNLSNLKFDISLLDPNGNEIKNKGSGRKMLYGIFLLKGRIIYNVLNDQKICLQTACEESYSEALEIVKKQRPDLFQQKISLYKLIKETFHEGYRLKIHPNSLFVWLFISR